MLKFLRHQCNCQKHFDLVSDMMKNINDRLIVVEKYIHDKEHPKLTGNELITITIPIVHNTMPTTVSVAQLGSKPKRKPTPKKKK